MKKYLKVICNTFRQTEFQLNISARQFPGKWTPGENNEVVNHFKACCSEVICTIFFFFIKINVGCSTDSSSADPVRLEFFQGLRGNLAPAAPLLPQQGHVSSLCSTEHHLSSTYYAGTTQGWRREVVHFGKLHLVGKDLLLPAMFFSFHSFLHDLMVDLPLYQGNVHLTFLPQFSTESRSVNV